MADTETAPQTGYAPVNGLQMYYEIHGAGGVPLLLLHGGLFNIDLQFGQLIPGLAATRQVVAADFQGHGRTGDIDRPLTSADLASDVVGLLGHLEIAQADVFGSAWVAAPPSTSPSTIRSWSASWSFHRCRSTLTVTVRRTARRWTR